jgi:hypothetical protein
MFAHIKGTQEQAKDACYLRQHLKSQSFWCKSRGCLMLIQKSVDAYTEDVDICETVPAFQPCQNYHCCILAVKPEQ